MDGIKLGPPPDPIRSQEEADELERNLSYVADEEKDGRYWGHVNGNALIGDYGTTEEVAIAAAREVVRKAIVYIPLRLVQ